MSKKIVIAFEGIEGSGKTFHIDNVSKYLKRKKIPLKLGEIKAKLLNNMLFTKRFL